jgi:predicted metal-binding membrane protein
MGCAIAGAGEQRAPGGYQNMVDCLEEAVMNETAGPARARARAGDRDPIHGRGQAAAEPAPRGAATWPGAATAGVALAVTLGLAAAAWVVSVRQMHGMDMGAATTLGSLGFFIPLWIWMMAAMMLPSAAPAVLRRAQIGGVRAMPLFAVSYLAIWALVGLVVYAAYRPHGYVAAGVVTIAAGLYELTPVKQHFRRRCREITRSGWEFGLCCVGSSIGLMAVLVALGVMSIAWMVLVAVIVIAQKLLPARPLVDVPLALALVGLGVWIVVAPSAVPWLVPSM